MTPKDILNIFPVVKHTDFVCEEGRRNLEHGLALFNRSQLKPVRLSMRSNLTILTVSYIPPIPPPFLTSFH